VLKPRLVYEVLRTILGITVHKLTVRGAMLVSVGSHIYLDSQVTRHAWKIDSRRAVLTKATT
jgi:hypothetical protein